MAHTFGTVSTRTSSTGNPITTAAFTLVAEDTVLVLLLKVNGATDRAGGAPTLSGLTFTQANTTQKAASSPEAGCELWYILNPCNPRQTPGAVRPGAYAVTIPNTGALTVFYTLATGRAKGGGCSAFDGANGGNGTSTNPTPGAIVTTEPGDIGFSVFASGIADASVAVPTVGADLDAGGYDDGQHGGGQAYHLQATAASVTFSWTLGSEDWGCVAAYFKEIAPVGFNNYMGLNAGDGISVGEKIR